ncbi:MAG TPA: hypothetical protein VGL95_08140 [Acetobacteraceae bacterium]
MLGVPGACNLDLATVLVRAWCWSNDASAHACRIDNAVMKMHARILRLGQVAAVPLE